MCQVKDNISEIKKYKYNINRIGIQPQAKLFSKLCNKYKAEKRNSLKHGKFKGNKQK